MIYLDNAATSYPKPACVEKELIRAMRDAGGNPGRSSHRLSAAAAERIYDAREKVAAFLGSGNPDGVVFTYNATHALNLAIKTLARPGCHIITSDIEHNSVIRPLQALVKKGVIEYSCFDSEGDAEVEIASLIRQNSTGIVSTLASNVTGKRIDPAALSRAARRWGLFLIVDASQAAGHFEIDLKKTPCDVLCAPSHKGLFGIQGSGFAIFSSKIRAESFIEGGSGYDSINTEMPLELPEGYEAGTPSTPAICTMASGISYISEIGIAETERRLTALADRYKDMLSEIDRAVLYPCQGDIISFNVRGLNSHTVADFLDTRGIYVRDGLHCAPTAHKKLGTLEHGTVRLSLSLMNSEKQADGFYRAMRELTS